MNGLKIIEYSNQRVLLTGQLAESYGTDSKSISYNFNHNKERYKEGKHYYVLQGEELKAFREVHDLPTNINKVYLWTERGAFLHAKSLNNDKAWEVYDSLVEHYFKSRNEKCNALPTNYKEALLQLVAQVELTEQLELENKLKDQQIGELKPKAFFADTVSASEDSILIGQLAKLICQNGYDIGQNRLFAWMRENGFLCKRGESYNTPTQKAIDLGLFEVMERSLNSPKGTTRLTLTTKVTGKGQRYFVEKFCDEKGR